MPKGRAKANDGKCANCGEKERHVYSSGRVASYCYECAIQNKRNSRNTDEKWQAYLIAQREWRHKREAENPEIRERRIAIQRARNASDRASGVIAKRERSKPKNNCPRCKVNPRHRVASGRYLSYCVGCQKEYNKKAAEANRERSRIQKMERHYGITHEEYTKKIKEQGGMCPVCALPLDGPKKVAVDHCHNIGPGPQSFRGVLHVGCNAALGGLLDDPAVLRRGADYLERWRTKNGQPTSGPVAALEETAED